jgi:transposase InsO family protein
MLKRHDATISMSRKGNPYDNAKAESFMKTLKSEEVYRNEYRDSLSRPGNKRIKPASQFESSPPGAPACAVREFGRIIHII